MKFWMSQVSPLPDSATARRPGSNSFRWRAATSTNRSWTCRSRLKIKQIEYVDISNATSYALMAAILFRFSLWSNIHSWSSYGIWRNIRAYSERLGFIRQMIEFSSHMLSRGTYVRHICLFWQSVAFNFVAKMYSWNCWKMGSNETCHVTDIRLYQRKFEEMETYQIKKPK